LKTSEEAATPNGDDILFTYATPTAEMTDISVIFDNSTFNHKVNITGVGLDETSQLYIDGVEQTLDYADGSSAIFILKDIETN